MRNTTSRFIAFFDECGDHSLKKIDQDFPIFVLSTVIFERSVYVEQVVPAVTKLKMQFWDHEGINLHNRDIRMAQGDFLFMQNPTKRQQFLRSLNSMISELKFTLFVTAIDKIKLKEIRDTEALNPYDLSMHYTFEKVIHFLEKYKETELPVAGIQLADLCAYPTARKILNPTRFNPDFDIIAPHFYDCKNDIGLKMFP